MTELAAKNLLACCFDSLGAAYKALQLVDAGVDVVEIFPIGTYGHLLLASEKPLVDLSAKIQNELKAHIVKIHSISQCPAKVLRAYLSVENADLNRHVLIAEAAYVGELMAAGAQAIGMGLQIMDLRMLRGASSSSYMFLTGEEEVLQKFARGVSFKTSLISNANPAIQNLFNLQP